MLDGRVLRSQRPEDIDQELYAVLTVYQAIVRAATDAVATQPGLPPARISFTVAWRTAADQVITAAGVVADPGGGLGAIGRAVLANLLPVRGRRARARTVKNPASKYAPNAGKTPRTNLAYTLHTQITIMEQGLTARPHH
jgi:hypothetical protein